VSAGEARGAFRFSALCRSVWSLRVPLMSPHSADPPPPPPPDAETMYGSDAVPLPATVTFEPAWIRQLQEFPAHVHLGMSPFLLVGIGPRGRDEGHLGVLAFCRLTHHNPIQLLHLRKLSCVQCRPQREVYSGDQFVEV